MAKKFRSARPASVVHALRFLGWLAAVLIVLGLALAGGVLFDGAKASWTPKLALDLEGGTQVILTPKLATGQSVSTEQLAQAVAIIRQRVDASGVSEAEVVTQGNNVVVSVPGQVDDQTRNRIESAAQLELRPVLLTSAASAPSASATAGASSPSSSPTTKPTDGSDLSWVTPALQAQYNTFDCQTVATRTEAADPQAPLVTCDQTGTVKYALGPVEVRGSDIQDAEAGVLTTRQGASTGEWAVNLVFNGDGTAAFAKVSQRLFGLTAPRNQFAFVLDGAVLQAPRMNAVITDGRPQITGSYTAASSKTLADQLKFGALPINFSVQSSDTISATLGSSQLQAGLIAGLIGLVLVVIYTLFQYRLLGLVTISSLVVAAVFTYVVIALLSWRQGYRLSLAGVAGLIVAIGFTADSFIVYFERVRDELREGKGLTAAVEAGWKRAFRTVLASKATNLLAAVVLYLIAVGNVRGFAFTLGVTTVIDVVIVILFTHPMLQLLAQNRFFASGHPLTGLDPNALGAVYRGRAQFRTSQAVADTKVAAVSKEVKRRQTIAERKAQALAESGKGADDHG